MSVQACKRCGQSLLPEIVRELGQGTRCPFCGAELDERVAKALAAELAAGAAKRIQTMAGTAPAGAPAPRSSATAALTLPGVPAARPARSPPPSPAKTTVLRASGAAAVASSPAAAMAVVAPAAEPEKPANPPLALVLTPGPEAISAPQARSAGWLAAVRRRPRLAVAAALALVGVAGLVVAGARSGGRAARPMAPAMATTQAAAPPPPDSPALPPAADRAPTAEAPAPESRKVHRNHHERRGTHQPKDQRSHGSSKKPGRQVALERPTPAARPEDDSAARAAYAKGNRLLLNGDAGGAIAAYEEATRAAPSSPAGYRGLGLAYEKQGKSAPAARAFRTYLKLAPAAEDRALITERLQRLAPQHKSGKRAR